MSDAIRIDITLEEKQALQALTRLTKSTEKFGNEAKNSGKKASTSFQTFAGVVAGNVTTRALTMLVSGFRSVTDEIIDFDKATREINTILPKNTKLTENQVKALSNLSKQFATSQAAQARSYYQIVSAGITDTSEAFKVLKASNVLAQGGLGNTETAILAITKSLNNFGDSAGGATDIADTLFTAVKLGQTRMEEFGAELPKVLAISKSLGLSFKDTAAALTTLTNRSENTSVAATELRAALSSILKNQKNLSKITDESGKAFDLQKLRVEGLSKFLKDLVKTTGNAAALQEALGGRIQSLNAVLKLSADDFQSLNSNIDDFAGSSGASQKAADENAKAIGFRLNKALQTIKVTASTLLTEAIEPMIVGFGLLGKVANLFVIDIEKTGEGVDKSKTRLVELTTQVNVLKKALSEAQTGGFLGGLQVDDLKAKLQVAQDQLDIFNEKQKEKQDAADQEAKDKAINKDAEELARLRTLAEEKAILAKDAGVIELEAEGELDKLKEAMAKESRKNALNSLKKFTDDQGKLKEGLTSIERMEAKKQLEIIRKSDKAELKVRAQTFKASAGLLDALSGLAALGGKKTFGVTKALAMAAIPINTAAAVMTAMAGPSGFVGAAAAGIIGATQLIKVATSKPPSFQDGGMVGGTPPIGSGDNVNANVRSGEVILNEAQQDNVASGLNKQPITVSVQIDGREIARTVADQMNDGFMMPQGI